MEWSEEDHKLYLVSDMIDSVFVADLDYKSKNAKIIGKLPIVGSPHKKGLESIRKNGSTFYLTYEKDVDLNGLRTATAFVAKAKLRNQIIEVERNIQFSNLPNNKGIEGLTLSSNKKSVWFSHETMNNHKQGIDSAKFVNCDTNLVIKKEVWYKLPSQSYFGANENAYDDYGITEILFVKDSLYVLERGFGINNNKPELFIDLQKIFSENFKRSKSLFTFPSNLESRNCVDNFEGMCYLPQENKLLIISDDNKNRKNQKTILRILMP